MQRLQNQGRIDRLPQRLVALVEQIELPLAVADHQRADAAGGIVMRAVVQLDQALGGGQSCLRLPRQIEEVASVEGLQDVDALAPFLDEPAVGRIEPVQRRIGAERDIGGVGVDVGGAQIVHRRDMLAAAHIAEGHESEAVVAAALFQPFGET